VQPRALLGIAFVVLAVACFAALDATVKLLGASISVLMVVWFRYTFQALVMAAVVLPTRGWRSLATRQPLLHALRGLLLLAVSTLSFVSVQHMPLGEFTAMIMLTPLVVTLLAAVFLRETVSRLRWLLGLGRVCWRLAHHPAHRGRAGLVCAGAAAHGAAVRRVPDFDQPHGAQRRRHDHALLHRLDRGALMTLALPWVWQTIPDLRTLALLCLAGLCGTVGHFLFIQAFARAPASTLAPYMYLQVGFALLLGWLLFGHLPGLWAWVGMGLIVLCGATLVWLTARQPKID